MWWSPFIVQKVSVFRFSAREKKSYNTSSPSISDSTLFVTDENGKQGFPANATRSLLNADGSLTLHKSGCSATVSKFIHCLYC